MKLILRFGTGYFLINGTALTPDLHFPDIPGVAGGEIDFSMRSSEQRAMLSDNNENLTSKPYNDRTQAIIYSSETH